MDVREAVVEDAEAIARLYARVWQRGYEQYGPTAPASLPSLEERTAAWQTAMSAQKWRVLVCGDADVLFGCLAFRDCGGDVGLPGVAEIATLNVDPDHYGRGAGTALCADACQRLSETGCRDVLHWVLRDSERRLRFYSRLGFTPLVDLEWELNVGPVSVPTVCYHRLLR